MVFLSIIHSLHSANKINTTNNIEIQNINNITNMLTIFRIIDLVLVIIALYFYFKCNFGKNSSTIGKKILGFLGACCCHILYLAYHLAVPC